MGWQTKKMEEFSREELLSLIETLAKNWLALDGVWFQAVEKSYGLEAALEMDYQAWRRYSSLETKRLMSWLGLPEGEGIIGLRQVLQIRPQSRVNRFEIMTPDDNTLIYCLKECRVQAARKRAGLPHQLGLQPAAGGLCQQGAAVVARAGSDAHRR